DERDLVVCAVDCFGVIKVYAFVFERQQTETPVFIRTKSTRVSRAHPQSLQRDHRTRRLAASGLFVFVEADLCIEVRVMRHDNQMIDGVQAKANAVELSLQRNRKRNFHSTE